MGSIAYNPHNTLSNLIDLALYHQMRREVNFYLRSSIEVLHEVM